MKTWHFELGVVAAVLAAVVVGSGSYDSYVEWIGAAAVTLSFAHAQVADRLAEKDAAREKPSVECHKWATRYLLGKEVLWLAYFIIHQSWSALAGVGLFLVFPAWRRWWRRQKPLRTSEADHDSVLNSAARKRLTSLRDGDQDIVDSLRVVVRLTGGWPEDVKNPPD